MYSLINPAVFKIFTRNFYQTFIYLRFVTIENFMRFWPLQGDLSNFMLGHLVVTKCHLIHHIPENSFERSLTLKIEWLTFNLLLFDSWNKVRLISSQFPIVRLRNDNKSFVTCAPKFCLSVLNISDDFKLYANEDNFCI